MTETAATPTSEAVPASQALAVAQQVDKALDFTATSAKLAELAAASKDITRISNKAGYDQVHATRMVLKNTRINIERIAKLAREDAIAFQKLVIARQDELIAIIKPEETRLQALQSAEDAREEAEKAEATRIEAERVAAIEATIKGIAEAPAEAIHFDADDLRGMIDKVREIDLATMDEVYRPRALDTQARAVSDLQRMLAQRIQADENAAALLRAAADLARMQSEQAEKDRIAAEALQAERDKAAAERAEADRIAAERQAAADAITAELSRKAQARIAELEAAEAARVAEANRIADEQALSQREAAETAEHERLEREQQERDWTDAHIEDAQRTQQRRERELAEHLEAERAENERQQRERDDQAEADRISRTTLVQAAADAHGLLVRLGVAGAIETRTLGAALDRELEQATAAIAASSDVEKQELTPGPSPATRKRAPGRARPVIHHRNDKGQIQS